VGRQLHNIGAAEGTARARIPGAGIAQHGGTQIAVGG
jgi:hypothetical protein